MKTVRCDHCHSEVPIVPGQATICLKCKTEHGKTLLHESNSEFCPQCGSPLDVTTDSSRLCAVCNWFGDKQETSSVPPKQEDFDLVLSILQSLELFRTVCRKEQIAESYYDAGQLSEQNLLRLRKYVQAARQSLVSLFMALRR